MIVGVVRRSTSMILQYMSRSLSLNSYYDEGASPLDLTNY